MSSKEDEYKEMFLAEALENYEELNNLFTKLEKDVKNKKAVDSIFRITHTLKGNAMGLGFSEIADLSHIMEDIFSEVKSGNIELDEDLFNTLFKANDKLGALIDAIQSEKRVSYKGIRTKLEVYLKTVRTDLSPEVENITPETDTKLAIKVDEAVSPGNTPESLADEIEEDIEEEEEIESQPNIAFSEMVQIPVRKLDNLLNLVGELMIERDGVIAKSVENGASSNEFTRLQRITSDLQYGVMDVRLVQIGFMFKKFNRIIRDVAKIENKKVDLILEGTEIEIDRNILKIISDALIHLVRNSVSHGIELPEERKKRKKSEVGQVTMKARNEKDIVIIEVTDDGYGMDAKAIKKKILEKGMVTQEFADQLSDDEIIMFIFEPGFSNAEKITEVSGRGVGMDVVKRATESIGGRIAVSTELGKGSTISLFLPSSMAVKGALLFELANQTYATALTYTEAVISLTKKDIHKVGNGLMAKYLGNTISVIFLKDLFDLTDISGLAEERILHQTYDATNKNEKLDVLVVSYGNKFTGLVVDKLLQQKEIVEKTLTSPLDHIDLISGATILGDGAVCLVLDVARIMNVLFKEKPEKAVVLK